MEEQQTPPKATRRGIRKKEEDNRSQQNSASKQASAALSSPHEPGLKSVSFLRRGAAISFPLEFALGSKFVCIRLFSNT